MKTKIRYYRMDRREIAFLKFILEAYEGIAGMRTMDPAKGIIKLHIAPGCEHQVDNILLSLAKEIRIQRLTSILSEYV